MPYVGKSPTANGVRNRFYFTQGSDGATSISGSDDNGKTLTFTDAAYVDVILNGSTLVSGTDYVATPSTNTPVYPGFVSTFSESFTGVNTSRTNF